MPWIEGDFKPFLNLCVKCYKSNQTRSNLNVRPASWLSPRFIISPSTLCKPPILSHPMLSPPARWVFSSTCVCFLHFTSLRFTSHHITGPWTSQTSTHDIWDIWDDMTFMTYAHRSENLHTETNRCDEGSLRWLKVLIVPISHLELFTSLVRS